MVLAAPEGRAGCVVRDAVDGGSYDGTPDDWQIRCCNAQPSFFANPVDSLIAHSPLTPLTPLLEVV